jgi:hypothetical protein
VSAGVGTAPPQDVQDRRISPRERLEHAHPPLGGRDVDVTRRCRRSPTGQNLAGGSALDTMSKAQPWSIPGMSESSTAAE